MSKITPCMTLSTISEPGLVFNSRCPDNLATWSFPDRTLADAVTGNQMAVLGNTPVLCSRGVGSKEILSFLGDVGLLMNPVLHHYEDEQDRLRLLRRLFSSGKKIINQHAHCEQQLPAKHCWIHPETLGFLNNKANLSAFVSSAYLTHRQVLSSSRIPSLLKQGWNLPLVIKAATNASSGGGNGVLICRSPEDIAYAAQKFNQADDIVAERFMQMDSNLCLNYAVDIRQQIFYLGATEQIVTPDGCYWGNWLGKDIFAPPELVEEGYQLMTKAASYGYRGFAAFDAARCGDGCFRIYDLNFRFNGSTTPLLLFDSASSVLGHTLAKFRSWHYAGEIRSLFKLLHSAFDKHFLLPFNIYNPPVTARGSTKVFGMLFGSSRDEILGNEKQLSRLGLQ